MKNKFNNLEKKQKVALIIIVIIILLIISVIIGKKLLVNAGSTDAGVTSPVTIRRATFVSEGTSYIESTKISCEDYGDGCDIILPKFNKTGSFSSWWSTKPLPSENLYGQEWSWNYFYPIGYKYKLTSDMTFYPNYNHFHYDFYNSSDSSTYSAKFRNLEIKENISVGETLFEFEEGIPDSAINEFIVFLEKAYSKVPWIFTPTKVFVMTYETYANNSHAYGLTHNYYYGRSTYITVDLKYDSAGDVVKNKIDVNAVLHELAHTWDFYSSKKGTCLHDQNDITELFNEMKNRGIINSAYTSGETSNSEWFAGMVTNYYWHILNDDELKQYYALNGKWSDDEKNTWKSLMNKYSNIKNSYSESLKIVTPSCANKIYNSKEQSLVNSSEKYILSNQNQINVGTYNISITPANGYKWIDDKKNTKTITCKISEYDLSNATISKIDNQIYTGNEIEPDVVVSALGKDLTIDKDYKIEYSNNNEVGVATVRVIGKGNYKGEKTATFKIEYKSNDNTGNNTPDTPTDDKIDKPNDNVDDKKDKDNEKEESCKLSSSVYKINNNDLIIQNVNKEHGLEKIKSNITSNCGTIIVTDDHVVLNTKTDAITYKISRIFIPKTGQNVIRYSLIIIVLSILIVVSLFIKSKISKK